MKAAAGIIRLLEHFIKSFKLQRICLSNQNRNKIIAEDILQSSL
jgi:hypothetical protein